MCTHVYAEMHVPMSVYVEDRSWHWVFSCIVLCYIQFPCGLGMSAGVRGSLEAKVSFFSVFPFVYASDLSLNLELTRSASWWLAGEHILKTCLYVFIALRLQGRLLCPSFYMSSGSELRPSCLHSKSTHLPSPTISHVYVFWEVFIQALCQFLNQFIPVLLLSFVISFWILTLFRYLVGKYFLTIDRLPFHSQLFLCLHPWTLSRYHRSKIDSP